MTMARTKNRKAQRTHVPEEILKRMLQVPMVRMDYTVKDVPHKGASIPKSVRVCDINYVRYLIVTDMKIGGASGLLYSIYSNKALRRQMLHVYNPYEGGVVVLMPQRVFEEHAEDFFEPKMIVHPEWEKEYRRLVEVTGIPEIPYAYRYHMEAYSITEGEKAYYEWKQGNLAAKAETGKRAPRRSSRIKTKPA